MADPQKEAEIAAKRAAVLAKIKKLADTNNQSSTTNDRSSDRSRRDDDRGSHRSRRERSNSRTRRERSGSRTRRERSSSRSRSGRSSSHRYESRSRYSEDRDHRDRSRESSRRQRSRESSRFSRRSPSPPSRTPQASTFAHTPPVATLPSPNAKSSAPINLLEMHKTILERKNLAGASAGAGRGSQSPFMAKDLSLQAVLDQLPKRQPITAKRREAPAADETASKESKMLKIEAPSKDFTNPAKNPYFDPSLVAKAAPQARRPRSFKFVQPGKYIEKAKQERALEAFEKLKQEVAEQSRKVGMEETNITAKVLLDNQKEELPAAEWWDAQFLPNGYDSISTAPVDPNTLKNLITQLVFHPIPVKAPSEKIKLRPREIMLTKKQRKKLRRQRRQELLKDKQDKIRLGLLPPDPPKVKISNLNRVLGNEAIQDPTLIEKKVRKEMAEREKKHNMANEQRKLTPEERRAKIAARIREDQRLSTQVAVFKIRNCSHPKHRFKIEYNAKQLGLTGMVIVHPKCNLVIVEGGHKGISAFRKLMLRRIEWNDLPPPKDASAAMAVDAYRVSTGEAENKCFLVWYGQVDKKAFHKMTWRAFESERAVREELAGKKVQHYWDAAILATDEELAAKQHMELAGKDDMDEDS